MTESTLAERTERVTERKGNHVLGAGPNLKERFEVNILQLLQFVVLKHLLLELSANRNPLKLINVRERQSRGGSQDGTNRRDARGVRVW